MIRRRKSQVYLPLGPLYILWRNIMPQTHIEMHVRHFSPAISIIDIEGDLSATAEPVLMDGYTQASAQTDDHCPITRRASSQNSWSPCTNWLAEAISMSLQLPS